MRARNDGAADRDAVGSNESGSAEPSPQVSFLDEHDAIDAIYTPPEPDGRFDAEAAALFRRLSLRRRAVILAFAPKAAGTFFRSAAISAADGQLVRTVHAQGERDAQFYLPTFLAYYLGRVTPYTMVSHVHMQAFTANRHFIEAFDLKPIVMMRSIPDMLASYWDMLANEPEARLEGLNCRIPRAFTDMPREKQADFLIDILGPWYASYFATWLAYAEDSPGRVCALHYEAFVGDPAAALRTALAHSGIERSAKVCRDAIKENWQGRNAMRFNRGVSGRGQEYFSPQHVERLGRMLAYYDVPPAQRAALVA